MFVVYVEYCPYEDPTKKTTKVIGCYTEMETAEKIAQQLHPFCNVDFTADRQTIRKQYFKQSKPANRKFRVYIEKCHVDAQNDGGWHDTLQLMTETEPSYGFSYDLTGFYEDVD